MSLQAITLEQEQSVEARILAELMTESELKAEETAVHPIAALPTVCGDADR